MKKISIVFIVLFGFLITLNINAVDESGSKYRKMHTVVGPDGKVQLIDYTLEQKAELEKLEKIISNFHQKMNELVPFFVAEKLARKVKDKHVRDTEAYMEHKPARQGKFVVNEFYTLEIKGNKVTKVQMIERKSNMNTDRELNTVVRTLANDVDDKPSDGIILTIDVKTNGGKFLQGNPADTYTSNQKDPLVLPTFLSPGYKAKQVYSLKNIVDPVNRLWLVKLYKKSIEKIVRDMDRAIERRTSNRANYANKMLKHMY